MPIVTAQAPLPPSTAHALRPAPAAPEPILAPPEANEAPGAEKPEESLAPRFAALARQQKLIRREQQALMAREAAIKAQKAEYETNYIPRAKLKENLLEVAIQEGYSYDQIAELLLKQTEPASPQLTQMQAEMAKMRQAQEEATKKWQDAEAFKEQQAEKQITMEAKLLIDSDPEYETIKSDPHGAEAVVLLIKKTLEAGGGFLSVEEAARRVEEHLLDEAVKKANLKKVRAKLFPESVAPANPGMKTHPSTQAQLSPQRAPQQQIIRTLTNAASSSPSRSMTPQEKRQRAVLAFMGQLEG